MDGRGKSLNRLLVAAAFVLVAVVAADALRPGRQHAAPRAAPPAASAPVAAPTLHGWEVAIGRAQAGQVQLQHVSLRASPETMFLATCRPPALQLAVEPGPRLFLRYDGPPCHVPPVRLTATVRDRRGRTVFRGPAAPADAVSVNLAGPQRVEVPLAAVHVCRARETLTVLVAGGGLSARGTLRCGGGR